MYSFRSALSDGGSTVNTSNLYYSVTLLCFFQQDYQICDPDPMAEVGCDDNTTVRVTSDDLELARQLDFDSESLPVDDQQRETDSSHLHGNSAGEIQILAESDRGYSNQNASEELSITSQVIGSNCPTSMAQHKVRPNTL